MDLFFEIHSNLPREGPGDDGSTARAFSLLKELPEKPAVLDVGCGPGMQTLCLARLTAGTITAVDVRRPFLEELDGRAARELVLDRVITTEASMFELPFENGAFDVVWSEGAVHVMGFENGLKAWKRLLKPGGYIAATEISWLKADPPGELLAFWEGAYPGIRSVDANLKTILRLGFTPVGHFTLPASAWWDEYYLPLERSIRDLERTYRGDDEATEILDGERYEIELYRKFSEWYGYEFYVMRVPA